MPRRVSLPGADELFRATAHSKAPVEPPGPDESSSSSGRVKHDEKMTIYVASELTAGDAAPMEDERIECRWFAPREMDEMIQAGKIVDGKTMVGYLAWKRYFRGAGPRAA